ncbi:MAG: pilin [Candidatus Moranbacteria bacterium]|nr:pilin [Candidatus Moranbacteria bacterium]
MRNNKYFFGMIFLAGFLFCSVYVVSAETDSTTQIPIGSSHESVPSLPADSLAPSHVPTSSVVPSSNTAKTGTTVTTTFVNPIRFSTVSEVVGALLSNLKGIIATVAILFIVIGGAMYILSGGNEKMITTAKNTITSAMIGLAIALAAPTFLKEIQNILGGGSGANPDELVNNALTLNQIAMRTLNLLLSITGILAIIGLVIGGSYYLTAYGDEKRAESGKNIITSAIIGIVIVMAALVIVRQIASLLGVG